MTETVELRVNIMTARLKTHVASAVVTVEVAGSSETPLPFLQITRRRIAKDLSCL
jgi:hypothetical protein